MRESLTSAQSVRKYLISGEELEELEDAERMEAFLGRGSAQGEAKCWSSRELLQERVASGRVLKECSWGVRSEGET